MATLADSLRSSTGRRLTLRIRPDLIATRQRYQGRAYWIVKDPVGLHYFRFQEEEYAILQMIDGDTSLDDIKEQFETQFPPQKIKLEELGNFVGMLHKSGLVLSEAPGQGVQLKKRNDQRRRQEWMQRLSNILSVRFRGINPEKLLNWMDPKFGWLYTRTAVICCGLLALSALSLVAVQFDEFHAKLPTFHQFFTVHNAFWLMVVLAVTKVIHEFGHGLTCKHFGGECHELGVMFLVLTPCLYCNVSDSWMLPSKWKRAMIGAGGMYIEIVIASICTWVWWYTQPGLLHNLCLSAMFVCSVSTVIFNGNPLLRYDGYYILSDLMEIPNLSQKATSVLGRTLGKVCLGLDLADDPFLPRRNRFFFGMYAVAAAAYRWVVVFSILFFLNQFFKPYRLEVIGRFMGAMSLYGLLIYPLWKLGVFFWVPGRTDMVDRTRMWISVGVIAAVLAAIAFIPVPTIAFLRHVPTAAALDAQSVYVQVPGQLQQVFVHPGDKVAQGATLARLSNDKLTLSIAQLPGERDNQLKIQLAQLEQPPFRGSDGRPGDSQNPRDAGLDGATASRKRSRPEAFAAHRAGGTAQCLPPPDQQQKPAPEKELVGWSGTPFEPKNLGATLDESTLFCQIGDPHSMEAVVIIDQADIEFLRLKQKVDIKLEELPYMTLHSEVQEIATQELKVSPKHLTNKSGGELPTKTDEAGVERPLTTSYQVRVFPLDDSDGLLRIGLRGQAKIHVAPRSVGWRLWRWFTETFHFRL